MSSDRRVASFSAALDQTRRTARALGEDRHLDSFAEGLQLLDRRRTLQVGRDQERPAAVRLEMVGELGGGRGLARALAVRRRGSSSGGAADFSGALACPRVAISSSWTIFTTCWPGVRL